MRRNKLLLILTIIIAVTIAGASYYIYQINQSSSLNGYENRDKMDNQPCDAISPTCGQCPGEIRGDYCYWGKKSSTEGLRQVTSYIPNGSCAAVNEPCGGYCPGTIADDKCYVKEGTHEQYK
jgi:hypothetical protein